MVTTMSVTKSNRTESLVEVRILVSNETGPGGIIYEVDQRFATLGCLFARKELKGSIIWIEGTFPASKARAVINLFFNPDGTIKKEYEGKILAKG